MKNVRELILTYLKEQRITKKHLAEKLGETPQNLDKKFRKKDFPTDYVLRISEALKYNFLAELAYEFEKENADTWMQMMTGEREQAYSVSREQEVQKWKSILERLPGDLELIKKQLDELNRKH